MSLRKATKRCIAVIAVFAIIAGFFIYFARDKKVYPEVDLSSYLQQQAGEDESYVSYIKRLGDSSVSDDKRIEISSTGLLKEDESVSFTVFAEQAGLYLLGADLVGGGDSNSNYSFSFMLNGAYPYEECSSMYFDKQWVSEQDGFSVDSQGNQLLPYLSEQTGGYTSYAKSNKGYQSDALCIYLNQGSNTVTIQAENQEISYTSLFFKGYQKAPSVLDTTEKSSEASSSVEPVLIEGESPSSRSQSSILEQVDRVSAATSPEYVDKQVYNTMGGESWADQGENITWSFTVAKDGYYGINLRCRQDYVSGLSTYRRLYLDGKAPSQSTEIITVPYSNGWQEITVEENREPAEFYMTAGEHTITLECTMGDMANVLEVVNNSLSVINELYLDVIKVISTKPDSNRDYMLDEKIPDVLAEMKAQAQVLSDVSDYLSWKNGGKSSENSILDKLERQLNEFAEDPVELTKQLNSFDSNISAIGTWIMERTSQPLEIDWIEILPQGQQGAAVNSSLWGDLAHSFKRIALSYTSDYDSFQAGTNENGTVEVWTSTSKEQMQIISRLCSEQFTAKTGIGVTFKQVQSSTIMTATIAGIGPDVTLMNSDNFAVQLALRGAAVNLKELDGFDEVCSEFYDSSMVPYLYQGGVYALPETKTFPVLFYRKDILSELGISVPNTWDELYDAVTELQKNNLEFGITPSINTYTMFLYQNGGQLYSGDGESSLINSNKSVNAFNTYTKFYTDFGLPVSFSFVSRFRTGEMPLAIQDYNTYNSVVAYAPEIEGLWDIALVPGTASEDGTINRSVYCTGTCSIIYSAADSVENSWDFLKWWVSADTQSAYAQQVEVELGEDSRLCLANVKAFESQDWTQSQKKQLEEQWQYVVGTPEVPGGYFTSRHIDNAFKKVVYKEADIRETLNEYKEIIDSELTNKRQEYDLETGG